jgi:NADP-dependent 3-hydroxy acid dehydrogenase YdfG
MNTGLCVLTGATGGIGQAIAKTLHAQGWQLLLVGRNGDALNALSSQCPGSMTFVGDLTVAENMLALAIKAKKLGGAKLLINNAGINVMQSLSSCSSE